MVSLAADRDPAPSRPASHLVDDFLLLGVFLPQAGHLPPQGLVLAATDQAPSGHSTQPGQERGGGGLRLATSPAAGPSPPHPSTGCGTVWGPGQGPRPSSCCCAAGGGRAGVPGAGAAGLRWRPGQGRLVRPRIWAETPGPSRSRSRWQSLEGSPHPWPSLPRLRLRMGGEPRGRGQYGFQATGRHMGGCPVPLRDQRWPRGAERATGAAHGLPLQGASPAQPPACPVDVREILLASP